MKVWLTATAERQLQTLTPAQYARVAESFDLLEDFPRMGQAYAQDSPFAEKEARYLLVRVTRNQAFRITYRLLEDRVAILYLFPATYPLTHPDHLKLVRAPDGG